MAKPDLKTQVADLMTAQGLDPASIPLDAINQGALESIKEHLIKHDNITSIQVEAIDGTL